MRRKAYQRDLAELEAELAKLQGWIVAEGLRVVVIFEGRDAAGKGGTIKRISRRLNTRVVRTVAMPRPTEREMTQLYLQRYISQLPSGGEMVLFDRSWYNRLGVERVMGFCTDRQYQAFLIQLPRFEAFLVDDGIVLLKYWLHVSDEEQEIRFQRRNTDPRRRWKLSPMDLEARTRWVDYSKARDVVLGRTSTTHAPWYVVDMNSKKAGRLNLIRHLLSRVPYQDLTPAPLELPERQAGSGYKSPDWSALEVPRIHS